MVRIEAARGLVGVPESHLAAEDRARLAKALDEYLASLKFNADRPEAQTELGGFHAARTRMNRRWRRTGVRSRSTPPTPPRR